MDERNIILRTLLWHRHGCPSECLYGDDGEIQCNSCGIDFKRDSSKKISQRLYEISIQKYKKSIKE